MKNQIIKKLMAFALVGAMVITTPMTASASTLTDAYTGTETGDNKDDKSSGTSTSTNTATQAVEIPEEVKEFNLNVFGITLDKETIDFDLVGGKEVTENLQARVLFDNYDPANEDMEWAAITAEEKAKIESNIKWYCDDYSVATVSATKEDPTKAVVKAKADGVVTVYAWLEADGLSYVDAPQKPTDGDYVATVDVTVTEHASDVKFDAGDTKFVAKRTYNLRNYTTLTFNTTDKPANDCTETIVYSNVKPGSSKTKATLTDAGVLKITKAQVGDKISFDMTTEAGVNKSGEITIATPVPVTGITFASKTMTMDMGTGEVVSFNDADVVAEEVVPTVTPADTTDELTWTSSKAAVASVVASEDGKSATIIANGVGTATITVKATSGKKATVKVTVKATPDNVTIEDVNGNESGYYTYSGKPANLIAVLRGENGLVVPKGSTKLAWKINNVSEDGTGNKNNAKVSSKGVVTPALILYADAQKKEIASSITSIVSVTMTNGKGANKITNDDVYELLLVQSDVKDVAIDAVQYDVTGKEIPVKTLSGNKETWKDILYVGQSYVFKPTATSGENGYEGGAESIAWTTSGKGITSYADGADLYTTILSKTKSTVKATYVTLTTAKNGKLKAAKKTKTITISPKQVATSLTLNKNAVVVNPKTKGSNKVTFSVKAFAPKNATDKIMWKVLTRDGVTGDKINITPSVTADIDNAHGSVRNDAKNKKITITIPGNTPAGSVIKVGAYAEGGAVAYAYIYVTDKTSKVNPLINGNKPEKTNKVTLGGDKVQLSATLDIVKADGTKEKGVAFGEPVFDQGTTKAYEKEPVSFVLDKKSAQIISVDADGYVTALKTGTATVTIKTISGKSAKVKIKVVDPN